MWKWGIFDFGKGTGIYFKVLKGDGENERK